MMKWNLAVSVDTLEIAGKMNGLLQHTTLYYISKYNKRNDRSDIWFCQEQLQCDDIYIRF